MEKYLLTAALSTNNITLENTVILNIDVSPHLTISPLIFTNHAVLLIPKSQNQSSETQEQMTAIQPEYRLLD